MTVTADLAKLESVAQQLVARLRDDDPGDVQRWLRNELGVALDRPVTDEERLLYVLAAAVPDEKRWSELIRWIDKPDPIDYRRRYARQWKRQARAAAKEARDAA